jgi:hypothetical protein
VTTATKTKATAGALPPWGVEDLPAPPPFSFRNLVRVIGPGAILLATSIGGGEWLVGPATSVKYGTGIMWIATIAILLQLVFNLEAIRYTLYTGEPIYTGFMRLKPGPRFWGIFYIFISIAQLGWPALVLSTAGTLFSMGAGRLPGGAADASVMNTIGIGIVGFTAALLLFGGTIERMLEWASWFMLLFIFSFLFIVNILFVPAAHWLSTLRGYFEIRLAAGEIDWTLLGALAATAASGGIGNLTITNWMRDKGFGMGARVGAIESAVGGRHTKLSPLGKVFPVNAENVRRWREWWRYVHADQIWVWALLCFVGSYLNVNLATSVIPSGTDMQGLATGAYQARYMADHMWSGLWYLTLLNGFWILYSTHLGNTDLVIRTVTDLMWTGSRRVRAGSAGRASRVYYALLAGFSIWALIVMTRAVGPFGLFKVMANIAGLVLAIAGIQIVIVNRKFLPRELRPPLWREIGVCLAAVFYWFFTIRIVIGWIR